MITIENGMKYSNTSRYALYDSNAWEGEDISALDFDVDERVLSVGDIAIPDKKALFRTDTNTYLATVSNGYPVIKHSDIVKQIEDGMENYFKNAKIKTILSKDGSVMQRMYTLPEVQIAVQKEDIISPVIRIVNSYDGSTAVGFYVDCVRLICTNGLVSTKQFMSIQYKHFGSKFNIRTFGESAQNMIDGFEEYAKTWRSWTTAICENDRAELLTNYMPKKLQPYIRSRFDEYLDGTKWKFYNALTAAITHDYKPTRNSVNADSMKIKLGAEATKLMNKDWYWTASYDSIKNDLMKKNKLSSNINDVIDSDFVA